VDLDIEPGLPALEVDADLVSRAIGNLIDNAIKYSPDGQPVEVAAIPNVDGVRLTVTDRGVGIPPRELPRIFEKFTRVNDPAVEGVDGSGLGLPIVRAIARAHGGDAWAESVPGEGTTVNLVLRSASRG
jgi:signal transduction histidine kinase